MDTFLGIEIRQILDSKTVVFVYFDDEQPVDAILSKHSRTCAGRRVAVTKAQVKGTSQKVHKKKRQSRRSQV